MGKLILKWSKFGKPMPNPLEREEPKKPFHKIGERQAQSRMAIPFVMPFIDKWQKVSGLSPTPIIRDDQTFRGIPDEAIGRSASSAGGDHQ